MKKLVSFGQIGAVLWLSLSFILLNPLLATASPDPSQLSQAVQEIEAINQMRSRLASTLENSTEEPTMETFKQVCKPVGMRTKQLGQETGWTVKQVAKKYRNPAHTPNILAETIALAKFEQDTDLKGFWQEETVNGQTGTTYYRRIDVGSTCLVCHGSKEGRPSFVKEKYPQDLAYNFHVGDLRGMYEVFIPNLAPQY
jgi:hypothetical protein